MQSIIAQKNKKGMSFGIIVLLLIVIVIYGIFKILSPGNFGSLANLSSYAQQSIIQATAACGFYFIMTMGLFDFSLGSNIILSAIVGSLLAAQIGYPGLFIGAIACGACIGLINGLIYIHFKIPSIIVTVGMMMIYECVASALSGGTLIGVSRELQIFAKAPWNYLLAIIAFILAAVILNYTKVGTYIYAIGSNEATAKNMGIKVDRYKVIAFVLYGVFVGIMSILTISYGGTIQAEMGMASGGRNYTPVMGCFFGIAFRRFHCPVTAIVIGEFIIYMMLNGLLALGVPSTIQNVIIGATLLLIVAVTTKREIDAVVK